MSPLTDEEWEAQSQARFDSSAWLGDTELEPRVERTKWWVVEHLVKRWPRPDYEWHQCEMKRFETIKEATDYNRHHGFAGATGWRVVEVVAVQTRTSVRRSAALVSPNGDSPTKTT